jgi:hypothetical protein
VVFPLLLGLLKDSGKAVALAAAGAADALHLRCFRVGDAHAVGFVVAELHSLGGGSGGGGGGGGGGSGGSGKADQGVAKGSGDKGGAASRAGSAAALASWLLRALQVRKGRLQRNHLSRDGACH